MTRVTKLFAITTYNVISILNNTHCMPSLGYLQRGHFLPGTSCGVPFKGFVGNAP